MFKKKELTSYLRQIMGVLKNQELEHSNFQPYILSDMIHFLPVAQNIFSLICDNKTDERVIEMEARSFLRERWKRIKNTPLCYSLNTECTMNWFCMALCELIEGKQNNTTLMYSVASEDQFGNEFDELELGSFILNDAGDEFICISTWIEYTIKSMVNDGRLLYRTLDSSGKLRSLSQNELLKLDRYCSKLSQLFAKLPRSNSLEKLQELYLGLQKGDVNHEGEELEAGNPAYAAIADFFQYYNSLSNNIKDQINSYSYGAMTLGSILNELKRDYTSNNGLGVRSCIQRISKNLNFIIQNNQASMRNLPASLSNAKLIEIVRKTNEQLGKLQPLTPNSQLFVAPSRYLDLCNQSTLPSMTVYSQNRHHAVFAILRYFVCAELDRLTVTSKGDSAKVSHYLNTLFAIAKESYEFINRPAGIQIEVLKEIIARITIISELKRNNKLISIFQAKSRTELSQLFANNQWLFESLALSSNVHSSKRTKIENILSSQDNHYQLTIIDSEEIANCYSRQTINPDSNSIISCAQS